MNGKPEEAKATEMQEEGQEDIVEVVDNNTMDEATREGTTKNEVTFQDPSLLITGLSSHRGHPLNK